MLCHFPLSEAARRTLDTPSGTLRFDLEPVNVHRFAELCGQFNEHIRQIEHHLGIRINSRGHCFELWGAEGRVQAGRAVLCRLYQQTALGEGLTPQMVHLVLRESAMNQDTLSSEPTNESSIPLVLRSRKGLIHARGRNQQLYVQAIEENDISFGVGPAGTGKTWLAVACAVRALEQDSIQRILLVRPAVEAGEKLGFLPGDLSQKIDPYLRPLYDALYEMVGFEKITRLIEKNVIEVAPLAYMRGRTLNNAFVILDESQNTTVEQMKMFLTRIGFGSTAVVTGDITQVDLPRNTPSGLRHAIEVLRGVKGVGITHFQSRDVVRHPLVQRIVEAYEQHAEAEVKKGGQNVCHA